MISTTSEYAIRALVHLARLEENEIILGRDLSHLASIPSNYLAKILVILNKAGYVEASRGPGGGYRLKQPPNSIRLLDVMLAIEGDSAVPSCILGSNRVCSDDSPCGAHESWHTVREAYISFLENTTIETITLQDGTDVVGSV